MVQLRLRNEANFATVEINVADVNDNPPQFLEVCFLDLINSSFVAIVVLDYFHILLHKRQFLFECSGIE